MGGTQTHDFPGLLSFPFNVAEPEPSSSAWSSLCTWLQLWNYWNEYLQIRYEDERYESGGDSNRRVDDDQIYAVQQCGRGPHSTRRAGGGRGVGVLSVFQARHIMTSTMATRASDIWAPLYHVSKPVDPTGSFLHRAPEYNLIE